PGFQGLRISDRTGPGPREGPGTEQWAAALLGGATHCGRPGLCGRHCPLSVRPRPYPGQGEGQMVAADRGRDVPGTFLGKELSPAHGPDDRSFSALQQVQGRVLHTGGIGTVPTCPGRAGALAVGPGPWGTEGTAQGPKSGLLQLFWLGDIDL